MYFDGSSWLETLQASDLTPGTGDFTAEWWQNMDPNSGENARLWEIGLWSGTIWGVSEEGSSTPKLLYWDTQSVSYMLAGSLPLNIWAHVAIVRQSNTLTIYLNGASIYTNSDSQNIDNSGNIPLTIGAESTGNANTLWKGYLTNFRINSNAVYTQPFNPPTGPLTADLNTKLLLLADTSDNLLLDSSGLAHTFSQNGNGVVWTPNSPW